ncbi:MAG TPA: TolC family protein [Phenylobacterium sp.]|nr:TolC family protein [Phenylobacterium sp.]
MSFRHLAIFCALAGVAGCASVRPADTRLPAGYEAPAQAAAEVDLAQWWTAFGDPQLTGLIEEALANSPDARSAAARLEEARALRSGALTRFLPQGNLVGTGRKTDSEVTDLETEGEAPPTGVPGFTLGGETETYALNFDVSWEVDLFGRIFAARRAANAELAAARFSYEGARASLAANVADSYFQARGLAIQLEDARRTAAIRRGLLDISARRVEIGIAAGQDADRIAGDLSQAEAQVASLEAELQAQRRTLLVLVGRGIDPIASLPVDASISAPPPVPATLPGELLARRPDVREAEQRMVSATGQVQLANRALFPTINFTPGVGLSKSVQPGLEFSTRNWSIGGNVTVPVLDIPRLLSEIDASGARAEQAVIAYEKAVQTAFSEAESALVRLDADRRGVALLTEGERRAQRAYNASKIGYDAGLQDLQSTLNNEAAWRATRSQLTAAQVQAARRAVQAYKALGGGWPAETIPPGTRAR